MKYALVGDYWGADEERESKRLGRPSPFVGAAGQILNSALAAAGISRSECLITNVFNLRPPGNKIDSIMVKKALGKQGFNALRPGKYLDPHLYPELQRLYGELEEAQPTIIVALGGVALWALTGSGALGPHRGHLHLPQRLAAHELCAPMIATYHPQRVLRQYHFKSSLVGDLVKAREFVEGKLKPAELSYIAEPTMQEIRDFFTEAQSYGRVAVDIETLPAYRAITCIGFGMPHRSICVPFFHEHRPGYSYWATEEEELQAYRLCRDFLATPNVTKVFQHCVYDIPWIWGVLGIPTCGEVVDTRVEHADLVAELPHDLSSITATWHLFPSWKAVYKSSKDSDTTQDSGE